MSGKLFISYSSEDRAWVDRLANALRAAGWEPWVDHNEISGGTEWRTSIVRGLKTCDAFLIILSPNSVRSKNVVKELSLAEEFGRRLLPVEMAAANEGSDMKYQLAGLQRVSFVSAPFEVGVGHLLAALESGDLGTVEVPSFTEGFGEGTLPGAAPPGNKDAVPADKTRRQRKKRPSPVLPLVVLLLAGAALVYLLKPDLFAGPTPQASPAPVAAATPAPDPAEAAAPARSVAPPVIKRLVVAHEVTDSEPVKRKRPFKVGKKVYGFVEAQSPEPTSVELVFRQDGAVKHRSKPLKVEGARYRTWSYVTPKAPGPWRVDVEHEGKRLQSASFVVRD